MNAKLWDSRPNKTRPLNIVSQSGRIFEGVQHLESLTVG